MYDPLSNAFSPSRMPSQSTDQEPLGEKETSYWLKEAEKLNPSDRNPFTAAIHALREKIFSMKMVSERGESQANEMMRQAYLTFDFFLQNTVRSAQQSEKDQQREKEALQRFDNLESRIKNGEFTRQTSPKKELIAEAQNKPPKRMFASLGALASNHSKDAAPKKETLGQIEPIKMHEIEQDIALSRSLALVINGTNWVTGKTFEIAGDGIKLVVKKGCAFNAETQQFCQKSSEDYAAVGRAIVKTSEQVGLTGLYLKTENFFEHAYSPNGFYAQVLREDYSLPPSIVRQYMQDSKTVSSAALMAGLGSVATKCGSFALQKISSYAKKASTSIPKPLLDHRISNAEGYALAPHEFINPKEFNGSFTKSVDWIRYHGDERTNVFTWFTTRSAANKLTTIDDVLKKCAILPSFGKRTHVSISRIPAGEPVRFWHGKVKPQVCPITGEVFPGGIPQYYFHDFDPKWVVETRPLD